MSTNDLSRRHAVRAITDVLRPGEWLTSAELYARMPEPRVSRPAVYVLFKDMIDAGQLMRRGVAKKFEYRSGLYTVIDNRVNNGQKQKPAIRMGFMALSRLERENPAEFKRLIKERG